jgi:hypothetical protein
MREIIINRGIFLLRGFMHAKKEHHLMGVLLVIWVIISLLFSSPELSSGINQSVPLMVVLALITYLILMEMSLWLLNSFLIRMGCPPIDKIVLKFKDLEEWKQLIFLWACYALVLLAGAVCLAAIL